MPFRSLPPVIGAGFDSSQKGENVVIRRSLNANACEIGLNEDDHLNVRNGGFHLNEVSIWMNETAVSHLNEASS
jgi:hypothetical protein